jgi:hypothetical protein
MAQIILSRIQRCHHCGREMVCPPLDYEQHPFCSTCLADRVDQASPPTAVQWRTEGHYVIPEAPRKDPSSGRGRQ